MKNILIVILFVWASAANAQSDYYMNFTDKNVKRVVIETNILDSLLFVGVNGSLISENYALLKEPQSIDLSDGKVTEKSVYSAEAGILSVKKVKYKYSEEGQIQSKAKITSVDKYPLLESYKVLFEMGSLIKNHSDTSYVVYKDGSILEKNDENYHIFFVYKDDTQKLSHKITLSGVPDDFNFDTDLLKQCIKVGHPYKPNTEGIIDKTALEGVLGNIYADSSTIKLVGFEEFNYDEEGNLSSSLRLSPPFVDKYIYRYNSDNLQVKQTKLSYDETGVTTEDVEEYRYDVNGYRWQLSDSLIYSEKRLIEVQSNWTDEHKQVYQETKFFFEYYPDGKLKKEIVPNKVEYVFKYKK